MILLPDLQKQMKEIIIHRLSLSASLNELCRKFQSQTLVLEMKEKLTYPKYVS